MHGSYNNVSSYIFQSTDGDIKEKELKLSESDVIIAGHSGIPFCDIKEDKAWINAGSYMNFLPAMGLKSHVRCHFTINHTLIGNICWRCR